MKKKLYLLTLATALTLSATACGNKAEEVIPAEEPTTVVEVADLESTIAEENTVIEPTVVEEPTIVEEPTSSEEVEEPTIVEESIDFYSEDYNGTYIENGEEVTYDDGFVLQDGDYVMQPGEWDALTIEDKDYITGCYKFLSYHHEELPEYETIDHDTMCTLYMRYSTEEILALINEDFSKAYDVIEKCGIDVETHDGRTVKATEIRGEIVDYDTFWEQLNSVTSAGGSIAVARGEYADGIDAINAGEITDYDTARYHLDNYSQYSEYVDFLQAFAHRYLDLTSYLH